MLAFIAALVLLSLLEPQGDRLLVSQCAAKHTTSELLADVRNITSVKILSFGSFFDCMKFNRVGISLLS